MTELGSLYVWLANNDCALDHTEPEDKLKARPITHFVLANDADACRCSPAGFFEDGSRFIVRNHPLRRPHNDRPRYWRERMFPDNFTEWTEAEHASRNVLLTWEQQQNVWAHKRAGEAWADGDLTTEAYTRLVDDMEPLPTMDTGPLLALWSIARAKARVHHIKPQPGIKPPPLEEAARPLTAAQLAETQAKVDRLREVYPDATAGQILTMLEDKR